MIHHARTRRRAPVALLATALLLAALAPAAAHAQGTSRGSVEFFAFRYWFDDEIGRPQEAPGFGGRVLVHTGTRADRSVAIGLFAAFQPEEERLETWHIGVEVDAFFAGPREPLQPFLSLGAGAFHYEYDGIVGDFERTKPTIVPGGGIVLQLTPLVGVRAEARDVVVLDENVVQHILLAIGLTLGL